MASAAALTLPPSNWMASVFFMGRIKACFQLFMQARLPRTKPHLPWWPTSQKPAERGLFHVYGRRMQALL